jgi:hypothetical protein
MAPIVSIVVNNFNYARFLRRAIDSALAQTAPGTEVVVVDDASTDGSRELIRSYGDRVRAVLQEQNGGQAAALNAGFATSTGRIVIFLDADDWLYPEAAARAAEAFQDGVAIAQYRLHLVDGDEQVVDLYPPAQTAFDSGDVVPKLLATGRYEGTVTSGIAYAREALARVLPIPAEPFRIGADGYLVSTVPFYGKVASLETPLGAYRVHGGNHWVTASMQAKKYQRALLHDRDKHRALAERAAALGLEAAADPGLRDHQHLGVRMASACIAPEEHPFPADTRPALALHAIRALAGTRLPRARRLLYSAWFVAVGVLPRRLARPVLAWHLDPSSRTGPFLRALRSVWRLAGRRGQASAGGAG